MPTTVAPSYSRAVDEETVVVEISVVLSYIRHPGPLVRVSLGRGVSEGTLMVEVSAMLQVMRPDQFDVDVQQSLQVGPILVQL